MVRNPGSDSRAKDEQDQQAENLKIQLEGCRIRCSLLEQQQIVTLDALDHVNEVHRQELDIEFREREITEGRLRRVQQSATETERERDELRAAVLELIRKVESRHRDLARWPYSRIKLSSLVADAAESRNDPLPPNSEEHQLSYAGAIIHSLQRALQLECEAHSNTRAKVHLLEAQVAHRDAELEQYIQNRQTAPLQSSVDKEAEMTENALDSGQVSSLLQQTLANNRVLELEVRSLTQKLEHACLEASMQTQLRVPSPPTSPILLRPISQVSLGRGGVQSRDIPASMASVDTPPSTSLLLQPDDVPGSTVLQAPSLLHASPFLQQEDCRSPSQSLPNTFLHSLDQQVNALAAQIDAFREEREVLQGIIRADLRPNPSEDVQPTAPSDGRQISSGPLSPVPEPEPRTVLGAPSPVEGSQAGPQWAHVDIGIQTESWPDSISSSPPSPGYCAPPAHAPPSTDLIELDEDPTSRLPPSPVQSAQDVSTDGEMSMELATPLLPLEFLAQSPHGVETVALEGTAATWEGEQELDDIVHMIRPRVSSSSSPSPLVDGLLLDI